MEFNLLIKTIKFIKIYNNKLKKNHVKMKNYNWDSSFVDLLLWIILNKLKIK